MPYIYFFLLSYLVKKIHFQAVHVAPTQQPKDANKQKVSVILLKEDMAFAEILQYIPFKNVPTYFQKVSDTAEDFDEIYSKKS